jgi:hypothetical protein
MPERIQNPKFGVLWRVWYLCVPTKILHQDEKGDCKRSNQMYGSSRSEWVLPLFRHVTAAPAVLNLAGFNFAR